MLLVQRPSLPITLTPNWLFALFNFDKCLCNQCSVGSSSSSSSSTSTAGTMTSSVMTTSLCFCVGNSVRGLRFDCCCCACEFSFDERSPSTCRDPTVGLLPFLLTGALTSSDFVPPFFKALILRSCRRITSFNRFVSTLSFAFLFFISICNLSNSDLIASTSSALFPSSSS